MVGVTVGLAAGTVGVVVGLAAGTVGVVVAPVVGEGVTPTFVVGTTVGLVVGTVGVVPTLVVGLVVGVPELPLLAAAGVVVKVAAVTTPLPSKVKVTRFWIFSRPNTIQATSPKCRIKAVCQEGKKRVSDGWHRRSRVLRQPHFLLQDRYSSVYQILTVDRRIWLSEPDLPYSHSVCWRASGQPLSCMH